MNRSERRQCRQQRQFEQTKAIAHQLYLSRVDRGREGNEDSDWKKAERIKRNHFRRRAFQLNQWSKHPWRNSVSWWESTFIERGLETLVDDLKSLAFVDLAAVLADVTIIISLSTFLTGGEQLLHDEQVYAAWQVITNAHGQTGNGGRIRALEFLNSTPGTSGRRRWFGLPWPQENLQGVDVSNAWLAGIKLPKASLVFANLQGADLRGANLQGAVLASTDLRGTALNGVDLQSALLIALDLRLSVGLTSEQMIEQKPFLCNVAFPSSMADIGSDQDCEKMPQLLSDRYDWLSLDDAQEIVDELRKQTWD